MEFVLRCAASAGIDLTDPSIEVDQRGAQNLVLLHRERGLAWRFPRTMTGCARLADAAARLTVLNRHQLPVPMLLGQEVATQPGDGFLLLSYCRGVALDTVACDDLRGPARARLVESLIEVVERIHAVPAADWPPPTASWTGLWDGLAAEIGSCTGLTDDMRRSQLELADAAAAAARRARIGVFHGDLGGVNCRIDPDSGGVLGLLDWDSATVGDVATDVTAILNGVGPRTADELRAASDRWRADEISYRAYLKTWPIQSYLWSIRAGSADDIRASLDLLKARPPTPV